MASCKNCGNESGDFNLCGNCKKDWRAIRLKAYKIVVDEIGDRTFQNRKHFNKRLKQVEKELTV